MQHTLRMSPRANPELASLAAELLHTMSRNLILASGGLDYNRLKDRLRVMRSESRHLANELKKGKSHDETVYAFERLMELVRDARELANSLSLEEPTIARIEAARKSLDEIAQYYDPDAPSKGPNPTIPLEEEPKPE